MANNVQLHVYRSAGTMPTKDLTRWDNPDAYEQTTVSNLLGNGSAADDEDHSYHFAFKRKRKPPRLAQLVWFPVEMYLLGDKILKLTNTTTV